MTRSLDLPLADVAPYAAYLPHHTVDPDGHVILLASNAEGTPDELGILWRLGLPATESWTDLEVGGFAQRLDNLLMNIPDQTSCQFILRSSRNIRPLLEAWEAAAQSPDPILGELARSRRAALEKLSLATLTTSFEARSFEVLFSLVRPGTWPSVKVSFMDVVRNTGEKSAALSHVRSAYAQDRKRMKNLAESLESQMAQAGIPFTRLGEEAVAEVLYTALNPLRCRTMPVPERLPDELLRERVALSPLGCDLDEGLLSLDDLFTKVVSVTHLPGTTTAGMLMRSARASTFLDTTPETDLVLSFTVCDQDEVRQRFSGQRRMAQDQSKDAHQGPSMGPHVAELARIEQELGAGARVVSLRIHSIVRGRTREEASDRARAAQAAFQTYGFRAAVENVLSGTLFLQSLPLAYRPDNDSALRRGRKTLTSNLAHLVPLYGTFGGTPSPTQLLLNRRGQPIFMSFFNGKEVPHGIVTGKSGAGKSVFANDLILSALRTGGRVWVLDRGGSYKKLTEMLEGAYVSYDAHQPPRLSPCGSSTPEGGCPEETNSFLRDWLTEMATHGKGDLSVRDQNLLSIAVRKAFAAKPGEEVFLRDIHDALGRLSQEHPAAKDLAVCISDYVKDGPYARFFDGPNQVDFEKALVAIDLADAALEDAVTSVLVMGLMYRIAQASRAWLTQDKYLLIDEAWTLLKSPACARFIENVSRTARKFRLSLIIVSQQITDLEGPSGRAILAQAAYKVCLHQDPEAIRTAAGLLGLNAREVELYTSLRTVGGIYSELFLKTPQGSGVARLLMDPLAYWLTTSDMADRKILDGLLEEARAQGHAGREALRQALLSAARRYPRGAPTAPGKATRESDPKKAE
jgi:type-IV secretion system protein TraC